MRRELISGVLAGAAGTTALEAVAYADMAVRGRPGSELPARTVETLTERAGVSLGGGETAGNRRQGLGALLGFGVGLGVGAAYGLLRARFRTGRVPAAIGLGLGAAVAADAPMTLLGLTDPRSWSASAWISDLVPHLAYGAVTCLAYERLTAPATGRRRARGRA